MESFLKCLSCGGQFVLDRRTRRRNIYKCASCGRELSVRQRPNIKPKEKSQNQH